MGREIVYCEGCGISLRTDDFDKGRAHEVSNRPWCVSCKPLPKPPAAKKTSTSRIPTMRPASSSGSRAAPSSTTRRRNAGGPSPALIAAIAAGVVLLLVLVGVALSSGRPAPQAPPPLPEPAPAPPAPRPSGARPAPPREMEPPPKADPNEKLETYFGQIRELIAKDTRFRRRRDALGLIAATQAVAGTRAGELERIRADYERAFDEAGAKAAAELRAEAEKLAAAGDVAGAAAKLDGLPEAFAETRHPEALRALRAELLQKAEAAARADLERRETELRAWKPDPVTGGSQHGLKPEHQGRGPVLETHPVSKEQPFGMERDFDLPAGRRAVLLFQVAPHEKGDWELRVQAGGRERLRQPVGPAGGGWREVRVDLADLAGSRARVRLETAATDWSWEYSYWADFELRIE